MYISLFLNFILTICSRYINGQFYKTIKAPASVAQSDARPTVDC